MFNRKPVKEQKEKVAQMSRRLNELLKERVKSSRDGGYILFYMGLLKEEETKMFRLQLKYGLWGWLFW